MDTNKYICTVEDLINHLKANFKPTDKICRWTEGGAYMNCDHVCKNELGQTCFMYVSKDKERLKHNAEEIYGDQTWINDNDVIIC